MYWFRNATQLESEQKPFFFNINVLRVDKETGEESAKLSSMLEMYRSPIGNLKGLSFMLSLIFTLQCSL